MEAKKIGISLGEVRDIELSDREDLIRRLRGGASLSCELAPANLLLWRRAYRMRRCEADGRLLIIGGAERVLHFPAGPEPAAAWLAAAVDELVRRGEIDGTVYDCPEAWAARPDVPEFFTAAHDDGSDDYLYELDKLIALEGARLRKKRNLIRQFEAANPAWRTVPVTAENLPGVVRFADDLNARLEPCEFLDLEKQALAELPAVFPAAGIEGLVLESAPGVPVGFSIWSPIGTDGFDIHFEKADHTCKGAPQMLTWRLACGLAPRGRWMNREQDMNEPGLRRAKESLDPAAMYRRVLLRRRSC